jgi:hypothetical protein
MLFPYIYVPHSIEKLQEYIDYLFLEVWCKASGDFDIDKIGHADLKEIILAIHYDDKIKKDHLYGPIESIFNIFKTLDASTVQLFAEGYQFNNQVEDLCKGVNGCKPMLYLEIKHVNEALEKELKDFFKNLFSEVIHLKVVKDKLGEIDDHYDDFVKTNFDGESNPYTCPFCGIGYIKGEYHSKREAYDHFLPKDIYAFNAINFKNLAPMCHECNSSYKLKKDPLFKVKDPLKKEEGTTRKAFYIFDTTRTSNIEIQIEIKNNDIRGLQKDELVLSIKSLGYDEEVGTWKDVFGIEERYKGRIIEQYGYYWYHTQLHDEYKNYPDVVKHVYSIKDELAKMIKAADTSLYHDLNFLKAAFLRGCEQGGLV